MTMREANGKRTFADGFIAGWRSPVDPDPTTPNIPTEPARRKISAYLQGLLSGIEAANRHRANATPE